MQTNQKQLNDLLRSEQKNDLSSQEEDNVSEYQKPVSRGVFRKPIKNPFSDQSDSDNSQNEQKNIKNNMNPFPPKPPQQKSILQHAQQSMKWNKEEQAQIDILSKLQGQGLKDKKIRELANKYKTLNIAYERQKTLRKNLQTQLNNQIKTNQETIKKSNQNHQSSIKSLDKSLVKDNKCTNPACGQLEKKVMQFRLQIQNLKTEINKAHRVITREIGQNFNIDQILNDENSWKGRQQKIQKLKIRVKQLQQKLTNNGVNVSHMSGFTQMSNAAKTNNNFSSTRTSTLADNKRKQFDNLKVQVDALKSDNQILQSKVKSLTSRKMILQNELKQLKGEYQKKKQILMQKSQNDDKFINLLKNENEKLKKQERVITKVVYKDQKDNDQINTLKREVEKLKTQLKKTERQSRQKQQKCLQTISNQALNTEKIQIHFPPSHKQKPTSSQRPLSSKKPEPLINDKSQRQLSAQKKKQLQNEYLKSNKYLKKLTAQEQISIYENWKSGKRIP